MNGFYDRIEKGMDGKFDPIIDFYEAEDSKRPELECSKSNSLIYYVI
jgi:hypothetical protein